MIELPKETSVPVQRQIHAIFRGRDTSDGAGVRLKRVFSVGRGGQAATTLDPFLMLDEFYSSDASDYIAGFPDHPHRGFETVTYILEGRMAHRDHLGNEGLLESGSVQWMTAGRGIIHSEMPQQEEGTMRGFQLWVNLPEDKKMLDPAYQEFSASAITSINGDGIDGKVIAGSLQINGSVFTGPVIGVSTNPVMADIHVDAGEQIEISTNPDENVLTYVYQGSLAIADESRLLTAGTAVRWSEGSQLSINAGTEGVNILYLAGVPLREPVVQYGPFVMNSREQIEQALSDYRHGTLVAYGG